MLPAPGCPCLYLDGYSFRPLSPAKTVLVFGPTGGVGGVTALTAAQRGAKVWLAMRDTNKPITKFSSSEEAALGMQRVQADLNEPSSLKAAVQKSGATHAFIYMNFQAQDAMRGALSALKEGGIGYIVMLSSQSIQGELRKVPQSDYVPYLHAQVELAIEEMGLALTAVRPAWFSSNLLRFKTGILSGVVDMYGGDAWFDYVDRNDIGAVAGTIIAEERFQEGKPGKAARPIYVVGAELITQKDAVLTVAKVLGRDLKVNELKTKEEYFEKNSELPRPLLEALAKAIESYKEPKEVYSMLEEAHADLERLTGRKPNTLEKWVAANKEEFTA